MRATSIRPPEWDDLAAEVSEYTVSIRWLETMGPLLPGEPRWLIASVDGQARVGLHARWLASPPPDARFDIAAVLRGDLPSPEPRTAPAAAPDTAALYPSVLVTLPGYSCAAAGSGAAEPALVRETLTALDAWAASQGARSVSFLYIPERQEPLRRALTEFGATQVELYPTCVLPMTFGSMDEYLLQLRSSRRRDIGRLLRRFAEKNMTVGEVDLAEVRDDVLELRLGQLRKYNSAADRHTQSAALDRMLTHYRSEDIVVTAVQRAGRVVGFAHGLRNGNTLRELWCGHLPEVDGAYFVTLFYTQVRAALQRGIEYIDYGTLEWGLKTNYGLRLEQLAGYMWMVRGDGR
ncbi:GNAT family N-acetyltransferase [Nocardia sp. CA2R105]|uniref:GNAT family N-acetyltransferase n=1 Tax=Nocardia coffeae TaxID=2873381 RepID=UPI001CA62F47|nr:GNAT family N-acetyltransferase [Nocardia coffeae]MBY8854929.1 GNAT family N-acetyltransferase [Nocardia coffeae]